MKRIVLIGPVYPYKGGISHYTGQMYRALKKKYDVTMVSYSLQYPKLLFKKEQKDYGNRAFEIRDTRYWINTASPLNWIRSARKINQLNPDLVIIQWWHPYFAPCYWMLARLLKDTKILFVCHNVFPHERFPMDRFLTGQVLRHGDYFIVQSGMDAEDLRKVKPDACFRQTVHPTYNVFRFRDMSREEGRKLLHINKEEKVLLFFGFVREYKGLKHMIRALPEITGRLEHVKLLIVGDFGNDRQDYLDLIAENNMERFIEIHDGYIPDQEVEKYFAACDLVVLPYESATQSGIVQIAYGFEKPVVVTAVGGLPDVVTDGKTGYVVEPKNPEALADAVAAFYEQEKEAEFVANVQKEAYRFSWDRMVEVIESFEKEMDSRHA